MRSRLTIFGSFLIGLTLSTVVACDKNSSQGDANKAAQTKAVGADSSEGKRLLSTKWCKLNAPGQMETAQLVLEFRQNGLFMITKYELQEDATLRKAGDDRGRWALMGNRLFMTHKKDEAQVQKLDGILSFSKQEKTATECLQLSNGQTRALEYCPCIIE
jgi:hypothetical protein